MRLICVAIPTLIALLHCAVASARADDKPAAAASATGPAIVENRVKEAELTTIKLTSEAETRLGIEVVAAEMRSIGRTRRLPGEVMSPVGGIVIVSAPVAGLLSLPAGATAISAGRRVETRQAVLRLQPGESRNGSSFVPADRISLARARADLTTAQGAAEGERQQAHVRVAAAEVRLNRADQLRKEGAGAQRGYDDARAEFELAQSQLRTAELRLETLSRVLDSLESDEQTAVVIESPLSGSIRAIFASPGQIVASGAPLLEIASLDPVWVRVPIYVGDLPRIDPIASARVCSLAAQPSPAGSPARRVVGPGTANPLAATVDLYFELANPQTALLPGQRVAVELPDSNATQRLVIPHAAVLFDIYGGAWAYESIGNRAYQRRRIAIADVIGDAAVLDRGLVPGAKVVTAGAAELFGTEFGVGK